VDAKNRQSSIKRQTRSPLFNEYFKFAVGFDELREKTLIFTVLDFDKFSHNELVGEVKVDFSQIDVSTTVEMWCDIEPTDKVRQYINSAINLCSFPKA
jgi:synaptotagmin-1